MDFAGDIVGDGESVSARGARRGGQPGHRQGGRSTCVASAAASSSAAPLGGASSDGSCVVCQQHDDDTPLDRVWRGVRLHPHCWNGVRCFLRAQKTSSAKDLEMYNFRHNLDVWRRGVLPLVVFDGGSRSVSARAAITNEAEEAVDIYEEKQYIKEYKLMGKSHFKAHKQFWEGAASDAASSEFEHELGKMTGEEAEDSDGYPQVKVKMHTKIRSIKGERRWKQSASGRAHSSKGLGRRKLRAASDDVDSSPERRSDRKQRKRTAPSPLRSTTSFATPTAKTRRGDDEATELRSDDAATPGQRIPGSMMTVVEFLKEKKRLKEQADGMMAASRMKSSTGTRLRAALAKVTEQQQCEIVGNPKEALAKVDTVVKQVDKFKNDMEGLTRDAVDDAVKRLEKLRNDYEEAACEADEMLEGVNFVLSQGVASQRKVQLQVHYKRRKVASKLGFGGYGTNFGKAAAAIIRGYDEGGSAPTNVVANPAMGQNLDYASLSMWSKDNEVGVAFIKKFEEPPDVNRGMGIGPILGFFGTTP